ncbi:Serine-type D-Ala-D-Ala carboxypeptidase [Desulfotomaculum nigrificans CO-1-SRB]|uniref:serine-type D-Ala-D-Ala carboxypeptidase n=1 Tax=Desulfotomaculum nigrificans (strain DSM 14880 / VKM B-2319 / CO-1-SRB) TaxID=868595 RepID=F6B3N6_DESCC|nr:Serine-type D-Ala-D-Ala carboxypeptidase [Desulfotomaculum nigrificans CO-1-SRB]
MIVVAKKILSVIVIVWLCLGSIPYAWAGAPEISGEAAVLIDAGTGQVLYGKDEHKRMYPASTTKTLTALVALEHAKLTDLVTIGPNALQAGGTSIGLTEGEKIPLKDLLYALMLNSANDAGVAIAEHISGSVEKFAALSNQEAKKIGAKDTHFTNPHGMPDKNHYSTAYDLALIARQAMQNQEFRRIVSTVHYQVSRADPNAQKYLFNHNKLLWSKIYGYQGTTGVKTGYTVEAGQCVIASAQRDGRELIAVVLHSDGSNIWSDATKLLDYGFTNFHSRQVVKGGQVMANIPVKYGKSPNVDLVASRDFYYTFPLEGADDLQISVQPQKEVKAPVTRGQVLGSILLSQNGKQVGKVDLVARGNVAKDWIAYLTPSFWVVLPLLFLFWLRHRIRIYRLRQKRLARQRRYYGAYEE